MSGGVARKITDLAQEAPASEEFLHELLRLLSESLGADTAVSLGGGPSLTAITYGDCGELEALAYRMFSGSSVQLNFAAELDRVFGHVDRFGGCIESIYYPTAASRESSALFQEVVDPHGIRSMLQLGLKWRGRSLLRINLNRHEGQPYRPKDLNRALSLLPTLEASYVAWEATRPRGIAGQLTARELEIAEYVSKGLTTPEIASLLGTSRFTVRNQLGKIYEKLELDGRAALAAAFAASLPLRGS